MMAKNKLIAKVQSTPLRKRLSWFEKLPKKSQDELLELRQWLHSDECEHSAAAVADTIAADYSASASTITEWLKRHE